MFIRYSSLYKILIQSSDNEYERDIPLDDQSCYEDGKAEVYVINIPYQEEEENEYVVPFDQFGDELGNN